MVSAVSAVTSAKPWGVAAFLTALVVVPAAGSHPSSPAGYRTHPPPEVCGSDGTYPGGTLCLRAQQNVTDSNRSVAQAQSQAGRSCAGASANRCGAARQDAQDTFDQRQQAINQQQQLQAADARRVRQQQDDAAARQRSRDAQQKTQQQTQAPAPAH